MHKSLRLLVLCLLLAVLTALTVNAQGGNGRSRLQRQRHPHGTVRNGAFLHLQNVRESQKVPPRARLTTQGWTILMHEDFEGAFPGETWFLIGDPTWGKTTYRAASGEGSGYCAGGGNHAVDPPGPYANNMSSWMTYGPFDLSNATDAELSYSHWTRTEFKYDFFYVFASIDGEDWWGVEWDGDWASGHGWVQEDFDLTDVYHLGDLTGQPKVWIAFGFESDSEIAFEGTYIDDITLRAVLKEVTPTPTATLTPTATPTRFPTARRIWLPLIQRGGH
jgi:hypothetical protein